MAQGVRPEGELLLVLGMGRSGTSLLTRVLALCGAGLPERLMGPDPGNPTGYWEPMAVLELNEAFLARFGSSWYDPTLQLQYESSITDQDRQAYVGQIYEFLASYSQLPLLVIKEPRITALFDFWLEAIRRADRTLKIVVPVRHPREVAASLAARDGVSAELSNALWLKYNLLAERYSRPFPRAFIDYSNLVRDWREEVARITRTLELPFYDFDEAAIDRFVAADLYRQRTAERLTDVLGQSWVGQVYAALSAAARDQPLDTPALDAIFDGFRASEHDFRAAVDEFRDRFRIVT